jgi:hypothetical protein
MNMKHAYHFDPSCPGATEDGVSLDVYCETRGTWERWSVENESERTVWVCLECGCTEDACDCQEYASHGEERLP